MRVIKLGGSLLETGKMFDCLKHILKSNVPTVVVCGGGDFANQIRTTQKKWKFDDVAAHEMAILAMEQTAIMCQNLQPEFVTVSSISEIKRNRFVIWLPKIKSLKTPELPASWDITSDSLAAWLTVKLKAYELVLVKSCKIKPETAITELTKQGVIDKEFYKFLENTSFDLTITSVDDFLKS
ncbi:MAG: uridylate kinase [Methylococcales bacterium]|nr:uridylate kinase [Methylococcales bacterium]MDD5753808.1 uridylate kinase [Methylococcales bacterium]